MEVKSPTESDKSPQKHKELENVSMSEGEATMKTDAESASSSGNGQRDGPCTQGETTPTSEMVVDEKPEEDVTKTKPKVHPFFGMLWACECTCSSN